MTRTSPQISFCVYAAEETAIGKNIEKIYNAIPTLASFHGSSDKSRLLVGPFRSGKSVAAVVELWMMALGMPINEIPHSSLQDKIIARTVCVRRTYRNLEDTVMKTFFQWVPKEAGVWKQSDKVFLLPLGNGYFWEVFFRSADTPEDIENFRGFEITDFWMDEAQEISPDVKLILTGRCSYPAGAPDHVYRSILTTNPCDIEHWIYKMYVENPLPGHAYWKQGARENPYLSKKYYDDLEDEYRDRPELLKRYINGEWGAIFSGQPVYKEEFHWDTHVAKTHLEPARDVVINRGWDFGLTPACIITQVHPNGQWLILRELWSDDSSIDEFGDGVVEFCRREYPNFTYEDVGDPSGRSRSATDEKSCIDILASKNIWCAEAETNALIPRLEAVKRRLTKSVKGRPRMVIDPRCRRLIDGFSGGYRFAERGNTTTFTDKPEKNVYSHIHDALQYVAMRLFGYAEHNPRLWSEPLKVQGVVGA